MACPFAVLDVTLDRKDLTAQAREIVYRVHPEWPREQVIEKSLRPGILNTLLCFHLASDDDLSSAVVVRVFGDVVSISTDRDRETLTMQAASKAGCFSRLIAVFNNGVVYRYMSGQSVTASQLQDPNIISRCCGQLAALTYGRDVTSGLWGRDGEPAAFPAGNRFFGIIRHWVRNVPTSLEIPEHDEIFQEIGLSSDRLMDEVDYMESQLSRAALDTCLQHGDLHKENILWDAKSSELRLIDYELSGMRYEGYDLAYLFAMTPILHAVGYQLFQGQPWPEITQESRDRWIRSFVDEKHRVLSRDGRAGGPGPPSETDYRKYYLQVDLLEKVVALCIAGIWLALSNTMAEMNVIRVVPRFTKLYFDNKERVPSIVDEILQLSGSREAGE